MASVHACTDAHVALTNSLQFKLEVNLETCREVGCLDTTGNLQTNDYEVENDNAWAYQVHIVRVWKEMHRATRYTI